MPLLPFPRSAQSGLFAAALCLAAGGIVSADIAPAAKEPDAGARPAAEGGSRMQAIAGGAGEDGSACLLQREGRALTAAPARGSVSVDTTAAAQEGSSTHVATKEERQQQQLLQMQQAQVAMKEAFEARQHPRSVSLSSGVSDGMGIEYSPLPEEALLTQEGAVSAQGDVPHKDKFLLLAIECFPPAWLLGLDRFYIGAFRTGIAKVLVSIITVSVGGFVWGLIDFFIIVVNALKKQQALRALGMEVDFTPGNIQPAFVMGVVDLLMLPVWVGLARYVWWVRKMQRMERLKENAMKSPHFKAPTSGAAIRGG